MVHLVRMKSQGGTPYKERELKQNNHLISENLTEKIALSEYDSKELLKQFGVPVVSERVAGDEAEAVAIARSIGFPVVVKAVGSKILHSCSAGGPIYCSQCRR